MSARTAPDVSSGTGFTPAAPAPVWVVRGIAERLGQRGPLLPASSAMMQELAEQAARAAAEASGPVLLIGERGTGKGRLAESLHARSPRAAAPFVGVRCAAAAAGIVDAALADPNGIAALAAGGTLFLDEVGRLSAGGQEALSSLIAASDDAGQASRVWVIGATRTDLANAVSEGSFREDLYYRLSAAPLLLPPLRARARADVLEVVAHLLDELSAELPESPAAVSPPALDRLARHPWPGNVRQLRQVLERALVVAEGCDLLRPEHLPPELAAAGEAEPHEPRALADVERAHVSRTLAAHRGNRTHAARELGISRATLIKKVREYGLDSARPRRAQGGET